MEKGFIKNEDLLKESCKVDDLLDFSLEIAKFKKRIAVIEKPSVIALVGPFGIGKSTMLYQIEKEMNKKVKWVNFDAWKYPDRKNLWEGFVLDFTKEISQKDFEITDKIIKGEQNEDKKTLINILSKIPGFAALEGLNHFLNTSPARRDDEIQKILKDQIKKLKSDLFIVVEDIDRSGDFGIFFLETLKQFISGLEVDKKLIVIVPISDSSYYQKLDSYLKSVDYFDFFQPSQIKLDKFITEIFQDDLFSGQYNKPSNGKIIWTGNNRKNQIISFFECLFREKAETTIRLVKLIIRKANLVYKNQIEDGQEPDFRITLCIEASKYFRIDNKSERKYFNDFKEKGIIANSNIFSSFLFAILQNKPSIYERRLTSRGEEKEMIVKSLYDFKFIERKNNDKLIYPSYPWIFDDPFSAEDGILGGITKFYLEY
jgi:hypothetical protein